MENKMFNHVTKTGWFFVVAVLWCPNAALAQSDKSTNLPAGSPAPQRGFPEPVHGPMPGESARVEQLFRPTWKAQSEAHRFLMQGDLVKAEEAAIRAINLSPKTVDGKPTLADGAYETLGQIRLLQGRPSEARDLFLKSGPLFGSESRDLGLTLAYCRLGDYLHALEGYRHIATTEAHDEMLDERDMDRAGHANLKQIEASVLLAKAQRFHGFLPNYGEAELMAAEKLVPNNARIAFDLGKVLQENKKFDEAIVRFKSAALHGHGILAREASKQATTAEWQKLQTVKAQKASEVPIMNR